MRNLYWISTGLLCLLTMVSALSHLAHNGTIEGAMTAVGMVLAPAFIVEDPGSDRGLAARLDGQRDP